jgi:hypothetical protein
MYPLEARNVFGLQWYDMIVEGHLLWVLGGGEEGDGDVLKLEWYHSEARNVAIRTNRGSMPMWPFGRNGSTYSTIYLSTLF